MKSTYCQKIFFFLSALIFLLSGCKKFITPDVPVDRITQENVYADNTNAIAVLTGIYTEMSNRGLLNFSMSAPAMWTGLLSDELTLWSGINNADYSAYYRNELNPTVTNAWYDSYQFIYKCNDAIEGLNSKAAEAVTPSVKQQLLGEAKFIRAFFYFNLVNYYGPVPLAISTDYTINSRLPRSSVEEVYELIIKDLKDARELLSDKFLDIRLANATEERVRPTKWVASALLAKTYLYNKQWELAEVESSLLINKNDLFDVVNVPLSEVFLMNSKEAIWQLQPVSSFITNTLEGNTFTLLPDLGLSESQPVYLSEALIDSFENDDLRLEVWTGVYTDVNVQPNKEYRFPAKYKAYDYFTPVTEYQMMFRLAEQYLIRAEARAYQGNVADALSDLNVLRSRAGLDDFTSADVVEVLSAIYHERLLELFTEAGHRWLDLKRTQRIDPAMTIAAALKNSQWRSFQQLLPLPQDEINLNPALKGEQNQGF